MRRRLPPKSVPQTPAPVQPWCVTNKDGVGGLRGRAESLPGVVVVVADDVATAATPTRSAFASPPTALPCPVQERVASFVVKEYGSAPTVPTAVLMELLYREMQVKAAECWPRCVDVRRVFVMPIRLQLNSLLTAAPSPPCALRAHRRPRAARPQSISPSPCRRCLRLAASQAPTTRPQMTTST